MSSSMAPWKLLMCIGSLWKGREKDGVKLWTSNMVGSMMLQFLPILAQRAHRKQEKLNRIGPQRHEALLDVLRSISGHIECIEECANLKESLEDYCTGKDTSKLGDFVAQASKALSTCKNEQARAQVIEGIAPTLMESFPKLFPRWVI